MVKKLSLPQSRPPLARMLHLHTMLAENHYPNCRRVARDLEVSPRTVQRDIDFMRDRLKLPIDYDSKRYGFFYTQKVTHFPTLQVSEGELVALFVAQKALAQYQGTSFEEPLRQAFQKLTENMNEEIHFQWNDVDAQFSFRSIGVPVSDLELFGMLGRAVSERIEINFQYRKLQGRHHETRHVQPYHMTCVDNQWYLLGWDRVRKGVRTFALPRIKRVELTNRYFDKDKNFSASKLFENNFGIFTGTIKHEVKILFDDFAAQLIQEKMWHPSQKIELHRSGGVLLTMVLY